MGLYIKCFTSVGADGLPVCVIALCVLLLQELSGRRGIALAGLFGSCLYLLLCMNEKKSNIRLVATIEQDRFLLIRCCLSAGNPIKNPRFRKGYLYSQRKSITSTSEI